MRAQSGLTVLSDIINRMHRRGIDFADLTKKTKSIIIFGNTECGVRHRLKRSPRQSEDSCHRTVSRREY